MSDEKKISKNYYKCGKQCFVPNCKKSRRHHPHLKIFKFPPVDTIMGQIWRKKCNVPEAEYGNNLIICENHFCCSEIGKRSLRKGVIPTQNLIETDGFAKHRLLKRDTVPTVNTNPIGKVDMNTQNALRIQSRENENIADLILKERLQEVEVSEAENENPSSSDAPSSLDASETWSGNIEENESLITLKILLDAVRKENKALKKREEKHRMELQVYEDKVEKLMKIHEYEFEALQKEVNQAKFELNNLESKLLTIFTRAQVNKLKNGMRLSNWIEEEREDRRL